MRTPKATIITAATYCCAAASTASGFLQPIIISSPTRIRSRTAIHHHQSSADDDNIIHHVAIINNNDNDDNDSGPLGGGIGGSEAPRSLAHNRSFLGIRRESGIMRRMMLEQQKLSEYTTNNNRAAYSSTALSQSATALMPDGGLSPCVIKVLGVGGGGSNAVRFFVCIIYIHSKCNVYYYLVFMSTCCVLCVCIHAVFLWGFVSCYLQYCNLISFNKINSQLMYSISFYLYLSIIRWIECWTHV